MSDYNKQAEDLKRAAAICELRKQGLVDSIITMQADLETLQSRITELEQGHTEFNRAIDFALDECGYGEGSLFLQCWREGDWDGCREFGFTPPEEQEG